MYLSEIDVLEIALLHLSAYAHCKKCSPYEPYLPCFAPKSPLVDIQEHVFATTLVLATVLLWAPFIIAL
jgi:hypothetical protein